MARSAAAFGLLCLIPVLLAHSGAVSALSPYEPASARYQVVEADLEGSAARQVPWTVHVWAPDTNQSVPVFFFVTGLAGFFPATSYSDVLSGIAARGVYVVGLHRYRYPDYPQAARDLLTTLRWAAEGYLRAAFSAPPPAATWRARRLGASAHIAAIPDVRHRALVGGQSAGGHVATLALEMDCSYGQGLVLIDPVDGFGNFAVEPPAPVNFSAPLLHVGTGLDPRPLAPHFEACAPAHLSNSRFVDAMRGPYWSLNATAYSHLDCLDDTWIPAGRLLCPDNRTVPKDPYRQLLSGAVAAFAGIVFGGRADLMPFLEEPRKMPVAVAARKRREGPVKAGCSHSFSPPSEAVLVPRGSSIRSK